MNSAIMLGIAAMIWALAVACGPTPAPTVGPSPSALPQASSADAILPTANPAGVISRPDWRVYDDTARGFEFRYPQGCGVDQHDDTLSVGRIDLVEMDAKGAELADFVSRFVDERTKAEGWRLESRQSDVVSQSQAVRIEYRFGGTGRYGTAVFFEHRGRIFAWNFTAGAFTCDEPDAYEDIVSSFRFTR